MAPPYDSRAEDWAHYHVYDWVHVSIFHLPSLQPPPLILKLDTSVIITHGDSGILGAIFRFILFIRTDLIADITWASVPTMTWTTAEPSLYLIAACLPALRPLLKDYLQNNIFKSLHSRRSKGSAGEEKPKRPMPLGDGYGECCYWLCGGVYVG